jgi:hypothetical protein
MSESQMTPLETALAALDPRPAALDRDRLMFLAGQRSARRRGWMAPCLSGVVASAATFLAALLFYHPGARIVYVHAPDVQPQPASVLVVNDDRWSEQIKALQVRNEVLRDGIEALPEPVRFEERPQPLNIDSLLQ